MATAAPEKVISKKPEAEEPPLAAVMEKPNDVVQDKPVVPPPHDDAKALASNLFFTCYCVCVCVCIYTWI